MRRILQWTSDDSVVNFACIADGVRLPLHAWVAEPAVDAQGEPVRPGVLLAMRDLNGVHVDEEGCEVRVDAAVIAQLPAWQTQQMGLPPSPPFRLQLHRRGIITDPHFTLTASFVTPEGAPIAATRQGAILTADGTPFTLHEPVFGVLEALDALASLRQPSFESRAPFLERIQRALGDESTQVLADDYLSTSVITSAESFTLRPTVDASGAIDFDVQPVRATNEQDEPFTASLSGAYERQWNSYFKRLSPRRCYPAGDGHFVVMSPVLQEALTVVKAMTTASPEKKRAFIRNPRSFLREALPAMPEEALEGVFWESAEYSARVREIGLWQPRVLAFLKKSGIEWLPGEPMGLAVGGQQVQVRPEDAEELQRKLEAAQQAGEPWVEHKGEQIPVTQESIAAARELADIARTFGLGAPPAPAPRPPAPESNGRIVLLIEDNLENGGFDRQWQPRATESGGDPPLLGTSLLSFQLEGFEWLKALWTAGAPGALLADDMGLGKTLQTLAFLSWLKDRRLSEGAPKRPILTVAPTGLLNNWLAEHDKHLIAPGLGDVLMAHGAGLADLRSGPGANPELRSGVPTLDTSQLKSAEWVLTTYEALRDYQHSFGAVNWGVLVFDEAQRIKNPQTLLTEAAKAMNADFTIALTGTPVENRLADLWTIVDTLEPGRLGTLKEFVAVYEAEAGTGEARLTQLKGRLLAPPPPLIQRRTKRTTLQGLPSISHHAPRVTMPPEQASAYDEVVRRARIGGVGRMLQSLQDLRAVSLHPEMEMGYEDETFVAKSGRLAETINILDGVAALGEKALVFVDARAMQAALVEILQRRYRLPEPPHIINGEVPGGARKARADDFQDRPGFGVLILSPRAGGVGLTITGANHVIHLGRWWNPAVEDQATDRVYRIGQTREVHVHTPLAVHPKHGDASFDVRLDDLLKQKRNLSHDLLAPTEAGKNELEQLLNGVVGA